MAGSVKFDQFEDELPDDTPEAAPVAADAGAANEVLESAFAKAVALEPDRETSVEPAKSDAPGASADSTAATPAGAERFAVFFFVRRPNISSAPPAVRSPRTPGPLTSIDSTRSFFATGSSATPANVALVSVRRSAPSLKSTLPILTSPCTVPLASIVNDPSAEQVKLPFLNCDSTPMASRYGFKASGLIPAASNAT